MQWRVNPHSGVPLYVQIEQQVKTAIAAGVLVEGDRLPTVRELALALTINPNTVARAYRELERAGLIETTPGRGTYVKASKVPPMPSAERERRLSAVVDLMVTEARALGFADEQVMQAVRTALARHGSSSRMTDRRDGGGAFGAHGGSSGARDTGAHGDTGEGSGVEHANACGGESHGRE